MVESLTKTHSAYRLSTQSAASGDAMVGTLKLLLFGVGGLKGSWPSQCALLAALRQPELREARAVRELKSLTKTLPEGVGRREGISFNDSGTNADSTRKLSKLSGSAACLLTMDAAACLQHPQHYHYT